MSRVVEAITERIAHLFDEVGRLEARQAALEVENGRLREAANDALAEAARHRVAYERLAATLRHALDETGVTAGQTLTGLRQGIAPGHPADLETIPSRPATGDRAPDPPVEPGHAQRGRSDVSQIAVVSGPENRRTVDPIEQVESAGPVGPTLASIPSSTSPPLSSAVRETAEVASDDERHVLEPLLDRNGQIGDPASRPDDGRDARDEPRAFQAAGHPDSAGVTSRPMDVDQVARDTPTYEIVAYPFALFSALRSFQDSIRTLPGTQAVRFGHFDKGILQLRVDYQGEIPLHERLESLPKFPGEVSVDANGRVILHLASPATD